MHMVPIQPSHGLLRKARRSIYSFNIGSDFASHEMVYRCNICIFGLCRTSYEMVEYTYGTICIAN